MTRRIIPILLLCLSVIGPVRAEDLRTLFIGMPDSIIPTLTKSERMDFLDYMDSGMESMRRLMYKYHREGLDVHDDRILGQLPDGYDIAVGQVGDGVVSAQERLKPYMYHKDCHRTL